MIPKCRKSDEKSSRRQVIQLILLKDNRMIYSSSKFPSARQKLAENIVLPSNPNELVDRQQILWMEQIGVKKSELLEQNFIILLNMNGIPLISTYLFSKDVNFKNRFQQNLNFVFQEP